MSDLGARGLGIQMHVFDGLHSAPILRLMRGRYAIRNEQADRFEDELARVLHWVHEWVFGATCISHCSSNAVVWSLKRYSGKQLQDDVHISIKSLRNSSEAIRSNIHEFARPRVVGIVKDANKFEVELFWEFLLILEDLLQYFVAADPFWDGKFLRVNQIFLLRPHATEIIAI